MAAFSAAGAAEKKRELPGDHALTPSEGGSVETVTETGPLVGICRKMLPELDQLASDTHDVETTEAIRLVLDRHGPGPYPDEDLAALAGVDFDRFRRVRRQLVAAGLARPADAHPDY
ncbi:hypothetical protein [Nocardia testacea]|uniref:hypothetical protein n=1 Tax=Nocardia testacea TaxID=248551 RepID=UPI0033C940B1